MLAQLKTVVLIEEVVNPSFISLTDSQLATSLNSACKVVYEPQATCWGVLVLSCTVRQLSNNNFSKGTNNVCHYNWINISRDAVSAQKIYISDWTIKTKEWDRQMKTLNRVWLDWHREHSWEAASVRLHGKQPQWASVRLLPMSAWSEPVSWSKAQLQTVQLLFRAEAVSWCSVCNEEANTQDLSPTELLWEQVDQTNRTCGKWWKLFRSPQQTEN